MYEDIQKSHNSMRLTHTYIKDKNHRFACNSFVNKYKQTTAISEQQQHTNKKEREKQTYETSRKSVNRTATESELFKVSKSPQHRYKCSKLTHFIIKSFHKTKDNISSNLCVNEKYIGFISLQLLDCAHESTNSFLLHCSADTWMESQ